MDISGADAAIDRRVEAEHRLHDGGGAAELVSGRGRVAVFREPRTERPLDAVAARLVRRPERIGEGFDRRVALPRPAEQRRRFRRVFRGQTTGRSSSKRAAFFAAFFARSTAQSSNSESG